MGPDVSYEKFYIPATLEKNKVLGFERDEIVLFLSLFFLGLFFSSFILMVLSVFLTYRYKKFKSTQPYFLPNFVYRRFYDVTNLKYMPRPCIKSIYGG